jgi:hypothetical protein
LHLESTGPALDRRRDDMTSLSKRVLYVSMAVMILVALAAVVDMATPGWIFARSWAMDILFVVGAGIVIYLALDALKDQK